MAKRKERVAPPPRPGGWDLRHGTSAAAKGWDEVCAAAPANARTAWEQLTTDPRRRDQRQHPLKGDLSVRSVAGRELEQWQYEVTSGGRLWYCIDVERRQVWLMDAMPGHPKATE